MATKARKQRPKLSVLTTDQEVKSARSKLPVFDPHDLQSLITEAKTDDTADFDTAFFLAFRRRNDIQMKELLRRLGVNPSNPDAWERGFFHLACLHHGVGHLAWYPRRTNRNSATWTPAQDFVLLREVWILQQQGLSDRAAVEQLACDPKKRQLFPYRKKGYFSKAEESEKRAAALRERLKALKASARGKSILDLLVGMCQSGGLGSLERGLYELAIFSSVPRIGKNQEPLQKAHS